MLWVSPTPSWFFNKMHRRWDSLLSFQPRTSSIPITAHPKILTALFSLFVKRIKETM